MKTIHFWTAYGISNQKNNVTIYSESHMAAILQNGCLETGFYQYLSLQIPLCMKYTHLWKAYGASNHKNNVAICPESYMVAILHFTIWLP